MIRRKVEDLNTEDCKALYKMLCLCMKMVKTTKICNRKMEILSFVEHKL